MKNSLLLTSLFLFILTSCEEVPPFIDFGATEQTKDTTYITSNIPAPQHKAVLIEDITGVQCNNCPKAATKAKEIITQKTEDSVVLIGVYTTHLPNFTTPYSGFPDLTNMYSFQIVDALGAPTGLPSGYVDRAIISPQTVRFNAYTTWGNLVNTRLKLKTKVNIEIEKTLTANLVTAKLKLTYTENESSTHKYSLFLTENNVESKQAMPDGAKPKDDYIHNHVLRYAFGLSTGNPLKESLVAGRVFEKELSYEIPSNIVPANCYLVCVVTDAITNEVVNVRQISLK
jgi:Outer membrane protein Omp28